MNTTTDQTALGPAPLAHVARAASGASTKTLATWMLASGVAALVVTTDHLIDDWAHTHAVAAWLALWLVAALAGGAAGCWPAAHPQLPRQPGAPPAPGRKAIKAWDATSGKQVRHQKLIRGPSQTPATHPSPPPCVCTLPPCLSGSKE